MVDAQELKDDLGERAKDIIADGLGLVQHRGKKVICPLHDDNNPSMSWFKDGLMWRCHACGGQIDIYSYYTDFQSMSFREALEEVGDLLGREVTNSTSSDRKAERRLPKKPIKAKETKFTKPNIDTEELTKPFIEYMEVRKINKDTLDHWGVKQRNWYGTDVYVFPYYDENKELVHVTYRGLGKGAIKGGSERGTKAMLWGMDKIDKSEPVVITEGQPDAMAVWQAGYKNVVSVPGGTENLTWIDHCWEWLQEVEEFIVFADNDTQGLNMARKIKSRLSNVKILTAKNGRKDANEVLFFDGARKLKQTIEDKLNETPQGLLDLANIEYQTAMDQIDNGIETGFIEYDRHVEDWKPGEITIMFGRNGEGKTSLASQIISHCIERDDKVFLYSGEMSENKIQDWLYRQLIGNNKEHLRTIAAKYGDKVEPKPGAIARIKDWHKGKLFLYDRAEEEIAGDLAAFFNVMEIAVKRYGVRVLFIDNLMAILEENADSLFSDQANFVQNCKDFAINHDCHIVLLAHPNKMKGELEDEAEGNLDKGDISGSGNIGNKADNIIAIERNWGDDPICDAIVTSLKDRETGQRKVMRFMFSNNTLRFHNASTRESVVYGWEKNPGREEFIEDEGFQVTTSGECPF